MYVRELDQTSCPVVPLMHIRLGLNRSSLYLTMLSTNRLFRMHEYFMAIFAAISVLLTGCSEAEDPSVGVAPTSASGPATSDAGESDESVYPFLIATHVHAADGEITESVSPVAPILVDKQFSRIDWTKPASIGVHINANTSMTIKSLPTDGNIEPALAAIWVQPDAQIEDYFTCIVRHSVPLESKQHALTLLQSFVDANGTVEVSAKWTVKSRIGRFQPTK